MIIYKATNLINGHVYIGKTIRTLQWRKKQHKTENKLNRNNSYFHRALKKYGWDNFEWIIIDTAENEKELNQKEIYWISEYRKTHNCYNMTNGGDGQSVGYKPSEETRKKISALFKGKPSKNKGMKRTEETKKKMSESAKGNTNSKGKTPTKETREKLRIAGIGNTNSVGKLKGENNGMYGRSHSEKSKLKMSESKIGLKASEETRKKMSEAQRRRFANEKTCNSSSGI